MKEKFKKWICKLISIKYRTIDDGYGEVYDIEILIKAMWKINRDGEWQIHSNVSSYYVSQKYRGKIDKWFHFEEHNNSELEALTKALEYIWENTK